MISSKADSDSYHHSIGIWEKTIMAKKKSKSPRGRKSRSDSTSSRKKPSPAKKSTKKKNPTTRKNVRGRSATKKIPSVPMTAAAQTLCSNHEIGQVAGKLWQTLNVEGAQSITALKKSSTASNDLVLAAVGWLAREDKLKFSFAGSQSVKVSLQ